MNESNNDNLKKRIESLELELQNYKNQCNDSKITVDKNHDSHLDSFQWAVENSSDAIGFSSPEGKHWYQNKAFDELFGIIGEDPPSTLYVSEEKGREIFKTIMSGGQWTGVLDMYTKNREIVPILLRAYAMKDIDNRITGLVGIHTDMSFQKEAEKALQESESKYRDLVDRTPDLLYRTDLEGRITYISPSTQKLAGFSQEEAIGMKMAEEVYLYPEERNGFLKLLMRDGIVNNFEARLKRKDGSIWWASTNAHFIKDSNGEIYGVEGITRDITDLKYAEEERMRLESQLNREDKMRSLGLMAGGIAHDLNNILSGIVSYPDLILMKLPDNSPIRKSIETIKKSGQRAADVVADLLTIARGVSPQKDVLNLNFIIDEYLSSIEHKKLFYKNPEIDIQTEFKNDLFNLKGSEIHIKKILMNLIANAVESITDDGIISITTDNRYLDAPLKGYETINKGEYVYLKVSDNGSGIPSEDLDKIFEPFYTKKIMGRSGTGLGLAVVWNSVQDHNGYINVKSNNNGTTFEIYFNATREKLTEQNDDVSYNSLMGNKEKILVIDDEEQQRDIAKSLLKQLNYSVKTASSGEEAISYLESNNVDLLVLDMIMEPGIDGLETYEKIIKIKTKQRAIITSGFSETERVLKTQSLGAGSYVKKPYTIEDIGLAIKKELSL